MKKWGEDVYITSKDRIIEIKWKKSMAINTPITRHYFSSRSKLVNLVARKISFSAYYCAEYNQQLSKMNRNNFILLLIVGVLLLAGISEACKSNCWHNDWSGRDAVCGSSNPARYSYPEGDHTCYCCPT